MKSNRFDAPGFILFSGALLAVVSAAWLMGRRRAVQPPGSHEDCVIEECSADGMPLSAYAG